MNYTVIDVFADIVGKVSAKLTPALSEYDATIPGVNYLYGPPKQIIKVLQSWNGTAMAQEKYPIVALLQPFEAQKGQQIGIDAYENVRLIIGRQSDASWETDKRYEVNFRPVLLPIYYELLNQIDLDKRFTTQGRDLIPHSMIEWPYWDDGKDSNPFDDWLDVIEVKFTRLKLNLKNC